MKTGNVARQIQQGVKLDPRLGRAKPSPGEERQAEVDHTRVEGIDRLIELDSPGLLRIEVARFGDQDVGKVCEDPPVPSLVRIGQRAPSHRATPESTVVELVHHCSKARLHVAQALPVGQLSERHGHVVVPRCEMTNATVATVSLHDATEGVAWKMIEKLGEDGPTLVHERLLARDRARVHRRGISQQVDDSSSSAQLQSYQLFTSA